MMTIEGVLHQRGSEMDLYSPRYFEDKKQLVDFLFGGNVLLYGQETVNRSPSVVTLDGDLVKRSINHLDFIFKNRLIYLDTANKEYIEVDTAAQPKPQMYKEYFKKSGETYVSLGQELTAWPSGTVYERVEWETDTSWRISSPPIPPEVGYLTNTRMTNMWGLRSRYLAERDHTAPKYCSIGNDTDNFVIRDPQENDFVFAQKNFEYSLSNMIYFVNGLCCMPQMDVDQVYGECVRLREGVSYLKNQHDRDRGVVGIDLSKQCEVEFFPISGWNGKLPELLTDRAVDPTTSSFLLVLDGRLYFPGEFTVYPSHVLKFSQSLQRKEYILDRMCCENKFSSMLGSIAQTRTLIEEKTDLKTSRNSFLIALKRKGLKVVRHSCLNPPRTNSNLYHRNAEGSYSRLYFNSSAHGILFDEATRSVFDYRREDNDMTHYDNKGMTPRRWSAMTALIQPDTRLEIWGRPNNDMSASATMHDRSDVRGSAFVLEPKYTMIEFLFDEG